MAMLRPGQLMAGEAEAIETVKRLGAAYGYGNLIDHLRRAWRDMLIGKGLDPTTAAHHVGLTEPEIYAVRVRHPGFVTRFVRVKDYYPESSIDHWCHGDGADCLRLDRDEAAALAARLNELFGADRYTFDVMAERLVPRWRPSAD